jgi:hypothetical protein
MSSPSNLYAEKVFAEHPMALWALDDKVDYVSLISENQRNLSSWTVSNALVSSSPSTVDEPFISSNVTKLTGQSSNGIYTVIECIGPDLFNFQDLNHDLGTFAVGSYIYSLNPYIVGLDIGYEYYDSTTGSNIQNLKHYDTSVYDKWLFISETFHIPSDNVEMRPVLKITYINSDTEDAPYEFLVNGITVGQWSEEFNSVSLGVDQISLPTKINLPSLSGVEAKAYGLQESSGYYILDQSSLCAKNSGVPMVYGASNNTIIIPNSNLYPGLIIPGQGFLNNSGKFKEYTAEMWIRVNSSSTTLKRIFGPIASDDGIYVDGPFIKLKISDNIGSFCVGQWTRPMLLHIRITKNSASLLINGEQVISLDFITENLSFPDKEVNGKDNDWLGFYAHDDVSPLELDCVAIYPYQVPILVAKRRFVYGQGVEIPENINSAYSGTSVFIDYPFADYANNYMYPDIGKWSQGIVDNLAIENNVLSLPNYALPTFVSSSKTLAQFNNDNYTIQNEDQNFICLSPNSTWNSTNSYLIFDSINPIAEETAAIYGVFKYTQLDSTEKTLIRIEDQVSGNYLSINLQDSTLKYVLQIGTEKTTVYETSGVLLGDHFTAGINLEKFSNYYGGDVASLLGNRSTLRVYVGGDKDLSNTFKGNIYKVVFDNARNFVSVSDLFNESGVPKEYENIFNQYDTSVLYDAGDSYFGENPSFWQYILDGGSPSSFVTVRVSEHRGSYELVGSTNFDLFSLDINVSSSWEDNIPLTYFAKYVTDAKGKEVYDLDFLQFNINYPAPIKYIEFGEYTSWTYAELMSRYSTPIQRTYSSLDNHLYTGYNNYSDLLTKSSKKYSLDTKKSLVRSYISFQYTADGANSNMNSFKYSVRPDVNTVVKPGTYVVDRDEQGNDIYDNFLNTRYEVVDNSIIYPPSGINFNDLSIVVHLKVDVDSVSKNPLQIRSLQIASQAFNESANEIGTRFGTPIYPYKKNGVYYDYKTDNPFSIYKGSSPYLYLTRDSGIQVRGTFDPLVNRGLAIPINKSLSNDYKVMAMQVAVRYDQSFFPYAPTSIFEIESRNGVIKFFMVADSPEGQRARVYAINANTGELEDGITFYLNGNIVNDPVLTIKEWAFIGISFSNLLNFNSFAGAFRVNGPLLVNLISNYKSTNLQEVQTVTRRPWFKVKYSGALELDWDFWDLAYKWQGVLVLSSTSYYGANPSDIYKSYAGTNKILVDDYNQAESAPKILSFKDYEYNIYSEIEWQSSTQNAV